MATKKKTRKKTARDDEYEEEAEEARKLGFTDAEIAEMLAPLVAARTTAAKVEKTRPKKAKAKPKVKPAAAKAAAKPKPKNKTKPKQKQKEQEKEIEKEEQEEQEKPETKGKEEKKYVHETVVIDNWFQSPEFQTMLGHLKHHTPGDYCVVFATCAYVLDVCRNEKEKKFAREFLLAATNDWNSNDHNIREMHLDMAERFLLEKIYHGKWNADDALDRIAGLAYHGTTMHALRGIQSHGIQLENPDFNRGEMEAIQRLYPDSLQSIVFPFLSGQKPKSFYYSQNPFISAKYAMASPEWFSIFLNQQAGQNVHHYQCLDYNEVIEGLREHLTKLKMTPEKQEKLVAFVTKFWTLYHDAPIALLSMHIHRESVLESLNAARFVKVLKHTIRDRVQKDGNFNLMKNELQMAWGHDNDSIHTEAEIPRKITAYPINMALLHPKLCEVAREKRTRNKSKK